MESSGLSLLIVLVAWILLLFFFVPVQDAFDVVLGSSKRSEEDPVFVQWFSILYTAYLLLVGYIGGSLVTTLFLGNRSFMILCVLTILFGLSFHFLAPQIIKYVQFSSFPNVIVASEYLLIPVFFIFFSDLQQGRCLSALSQRQRIILAVVIVTTLLMIAIVAWILCPTISTIS